MHKWLIVLALMISTRLLFGQNTDRSKAPYMFLGFEPSSINLAIGGQDVQKSNDFNVSFDLLAIIKN